MKINLNKTIEYNGYIFQKGESYRVDDELGAVLLSLDKPKVKLKTEFKTNKLK